MAAYVLDDAPPPPLLVKAWDYEMWGVNLFELPAGQLPGLRTAMNTYRAILSYRNANGRTAAWANANPSTFAFVMDIIKARRARASNG